MTWENLAIEEVELLALMLNNATLNGKIQANGSPSSTSEFKNYHAGSGGYIYIKCASPSICDISNDVNANGGIGSDSDKSNAGSGGRIVFTSVHIKPEKYTVYGGCSNILTSSNYNGAAGTVYFTDSKKLIIKHTTKCLASMRTVVDPVEISKVDSCEVIDQATLTFSNKKIKRNKMNVEIQSLSLVNSTLANPISGNGKDLGKMNIVVKEDLLIENSTLANIAVSLSINAKYLNLTKTSIIKYHEILSLNVTGYFNISGLISPNQQMINGVSPSIQEKRDQPSSVVYIYAGNTTKSENHTNTISEGSPEFVFEETSRVNGYFIMLFTDKNITIKGTFENTVEKDDGEKVIIESCRYSKILSLIVIYCF